MSRFAWILMAAALQGAGGPPSSGGRVEREAYVMGTRFHVDVEAASRPEAVAAAEAALAEVERWEALLSTWDPTTPMSRLNAAPVGVETPAPPELLALLGEAWRWSRDTEGAFDPGVGALVDAWDLRGAGRVPSDEDLARALEASAPGAFTWDGARGVAARRVAGAWIDTGGFGKGAALRAAAGVLRARGVERAWLDLGGQVLALAPASGPPWPVGVAHPVRREEPFARLLLSGVSAATSGTSERWVEVAGERFGHLLDPRTGRPCPSWGSVTVVDPDPLVADVLSTALYVLGPEHGLAWARKHPDVAALFLVERDGDVEARWTPAMRPWLDPTSIPMKQNER